VALDAGPSNGDRAGVCRRSEGDHEGCIREVPQEERSMYIAQNVCIIVKRFNLIASITGKPISEIYIGHVIDVYIYLFLLNIFIAF
jgi:hypothetical protein